MIKIYFHFDNIMLVRNTWLLDRRAPKKYWLLDNYYISLYSFADFLILILYFESNRQT